MKFFNLVIIICGIIVILNAGGITTASGGVVKGLLNGGLVNFQSSEYWGELTLILSLSILTGAAASLFGRSPDPSYVLATLASVFGGLVFADMLTIYKLLWDFGEIWIRWVASAVFIPLSVGFFMSLISWWRGTEA